MRIFPVCLLLACSAVTLAQAPTPASQTNPDDVVARPTPKYDAVQQPLNPALPTVFLVGDSTAQNKADLGWGDHFAHYFDTTKINVANRARAGRSSRTFIHEGAWDAVLAQVKKGDFVLIQMGHNDGGDLDGPKPRGTLKGIGEEQKEVTLQDGTKETVHTFGWYLRKYIADTRAKGATPILLNLTVRNIWTDGRIERDMGYDGFIRQTAMAEHVAFVDMATIEANKLEAMGQEKTKLLFPIDHTHTSAEGAELNASCVVQALWQSGSVLTPFLKLQL
ncbi:rhamnogalacturonan acetylesterase [Terriglobus tenax]|uniref:rhamnogalacturonan acetylesterase n=1 Tax=Terriglobus tenax TaxID=1111115 RepID=UPI0021E058BA|nr:rhamnogalacturonan acetylesterase [Terriglobus tenax]